MQALHQSVTSVITFFLGLARKQELLKKRVEEFEVNYNGEVEDCEKDFEETCERNEKTMQDLHGAIDDAAHHETLDELKQQTFDHLDQMALGYRDHADQMLQIHNRYPGEAQDLIRRETRGYCKDGPGERERERDQQEKKAERARRDRGLGIFCKDLGLALDPSEDAPALAAERKAQTASLEEDAVNKAKAALSPPSPTRPGSNDLSLSLILSADLCC